MPTSNTANQCTIQQASDRTLQADNDKKLQFPEIVQTSLGPDIFIQSTATTHLVIVERTRFLWGEITWCIGKTKKPFTQTYWQRAWMANHKLFPADLCFSRIPSSICINHTELLWQSRKKPIELRSNTFQNDMVEKRAGEREAIQWGVAPMITADTPLWREWVCPGLKWLKGSKHYDGQIPGVDLTWKLRLKLLHWLNYFSPVFCEKYNLQAVTTFFIIF